MADYKGYTFKVRDRHTEVLSSPYGETIAVLTKSLDGESLMSTVDGVKCRNNYKHRGEMLRDVADQHLAMIGEFDEEPILTPTESRVIIIQSVQNLQVNSNAFGMQITNSQVEEIKIAVEKASAVTLKRILQEWLPQAFLGASLGQLVTLLGIVLL